MKRSLFNLAAGVSMLLFLATLGLWVRSYWISDAVARLSGAGEIGMQSARGIIGVFADNTGHRQTTYHLDHWAADFSFWPAAQRSIFNRFGFGYTSNRRALATIQNIKPNPDIVYPPILVSRMIFFPEWLPAILFASIPGIWIYRVLRKRRREHLNLCAVCGYDLRATPQRCPECGTMAISASHPLPADNRRR